MTRTSGWQIKQEKIHPMIEAQEAWSLLGRVSGSDRAVLLLHGSESSDSPERVCFLNASSHLVQSDSTTSSTMAFDVDVDIDHIACLGAPFHHMAPLPSQFHMWAFHLGIDNQTRVIIHSSDPHVRACRVFWLFRLFGFHKVQIVNGGTQALMAEAPRRYEVLARLQSLTEIRRYHPSSMNTIEAQQNLTERPAGFFDYYQALLSNRFVVTRNLRTQISQVVDARSPERFKGAKSSLRPSEAGGSIPGSINLPYTNVLREGSYFRDSRQIHEAVAIAGIDTTHPIICTCGSGVTACVLFVALTLIDAPRVSVFDGSWQEWSTRATDEIAQQAPVRLNV